MNIHDVVGYVDQHHITEINSFVAVPNANLIKFSRHRRDLFLHNSVGGVEKNKDPINFRTPHKQLDI